MNQDPVRREKFFDDRSKTIEANSKLILVVVFVSFTDSVDLKFPVQAALRTERNVQKGRILANWNKSNPDKQRGVNKKGGGPASESDPFCCVVKGMADVRDSI